MGDSCLIVGGGAAGLAAAAYFAKRGVPALLLERLPRVGKKILATGSGRCNLANRQMSPERYQKAGDFVRRMYTRTPPKDALDLLASLGLWFLEEEDRIYPRTKMASSVLDALRAPLERGCVRAETGVRVTGLSFSGGLWRAQAEDGRAFSAPFVLFCPGGSAAPKFGTDGTAARLAGKLGHTLIPAVPALVQLRCQNAALPSLKGLRAQAGAELFIGGVPAGKETGELLFTDYGVSGIPVMQLSGRAARALSGGQQVSLSLDLLPERPSFRSAADLRLRAAALHSADLAALLCGLFPRMLARAILREAGLSPEEAPETLPEEALSRLARVLHGFPLPVTGTLGFEHAQVTSGGVSLSQVSPETMESALCPGLFFAGEVLDADGPCGGYNLHFAFTSGLAAARAIEGRIAARKEESR